MRSFHVAVQRIARATAARSACGIIARPPFCGCRPTSSIAQRGQPWRPAPGTTAARPASARRTASRRRTDLSAAGVHRPLGHRPSPSDARIQFGNPSALDGGSGAVGPSNPARPMTGLAHWLVEPMRVWDSSGTGCRGQGYEPVGASWPRPPFVLYPADTLGQPAHRDIAGIDRLRHLARGLLRDAGAALPARYPRFRRDHHPARSGAGTFPTAFFFSAVYTESLFLLPPPAACLPRDRQLVACPSSACSRRSPAPQA